VQLARVIGTVVATVKTPGLQGVKLLVIQPLDRHQRPAGAQLVAADAVHMAGPGELVYFVAAREAAQAMPDPFVPVDHAIVGIVDAVRSLAGGDQAERPAAADRPVAAATVPAEPPTPPEARAAKRRPRRPRP
jgi:ethanolamine utilization protein EutN